MALKINNTTITKINVIKNGITTALTHLYSNNVLVWVSTISLGNVSASAATGDPGLYTGSTGYGEYFDVSGYSSITGTVQASASPNKTGEYGIHTTGSAKLVNAHGATVRETGASEAYANVAGQPGYGSTGYIDWNLSGLSGLHRIVVSVSVFRENSDSAATGTGRVGTNNLTMK